jgi:hypothetical protein
MLRLCNAGLYNTGYVLIVNIATVEVSRLCGKKMTARKSTTASYDSKEK